MTRNRNDSFTRRSVIFNHVLPSFAAFSLPGTTSKAFHLQLDVANSARLSVDNVLHEGFTDVFEKPPEYYLLKNVKTLRDRIINYTIDWINCDKPSMMRFSSIDYFDVPKSRYGERRTCCDIDPVDTIVYLTLAILLAPKIELQRQSKSLKTVFSYRFNPNGGALFDKRYNHRTFRNQILLQKRNYAYMVRTDIKNFYPSISHKTLMEALDNSSVEGKIAEKTATLLHHWAIEKHGLPIGSNASRILAEAILTDIDHKLTFAEIKHCRYVDDIIMFFDDKQTANEGLEFLESEIYQKNMQLNMSKTEIIPIDSKLEPLMKDGVPGIRRKKNYPVAPLFSGEQQIPFQFRLPRKSEYEKLKYVELDALELDFSSQPPAPPWRVRRLIRAIIIKKSITHVRILSHIITNFPEFTSYICLGLCRSQSALDASYCLEISDRLGETLNDESVPDFSAVHIVYLLSQPRFANRKAILRYSRNLSVNASRVCLRASLMALSRSGGIPSDMVKIWLNEGSWTNRIFLSENDVESIIGNIKLDYPLDPLTSFLINPPGASDV